METNQGSIKTQAFAGLTPCVHFIKEHNSYKKFNGAVYKHICAHKPGNSNGTGKPFRPFRSEDKIAVCHPVSVYFVCALLLLGVAASAQVDIQ